MTADRERRRAARPVANATLDARACSAAIAAELRDTGAVRACFQRLLTPDAASSEVDTLDLLAKLLEPLLESALQSVIRADGLYFAGLRRFYLEPQETYSIAELATLWCVPADDVRDVFNDELLMWAETNPGRADDLRIHWADAVRACETFGVVRAFDIESALGEQFGRARSASWHTLAVVLHLPRFVTDTICGHAHLDSARDCSAAIERFVLDAVAAENVSPVTRTQPQ